MQSICRGEDTESCLWYLPSLQYVGLVLGGGLGDSLGVGNRSSAFGVSTLVGNSSHGTDQTNATNSHKGGGSRGHAAG